MALSIITTSILISLYMARDRVTITEEADSLRVEINGELFTQYRYTGAPHVYYYPVMGPLGLPITRNFPMKDVEGLATHLWRHAVATGCFVKDIARLLKGHSEGNFICGLFHNVGKPMVLNSLAAFEDRRTQPILSTDVVLGLNEYHVSVGGELARSWNLPQRVEESIRYFRDYDKAPSFRTTATMVSLGSQLGAFLICTEGMPTREDAEDIAELPVSQDLGFTADDIESLFKHTRRTRDIVDSML